jgi:hypothetical protein
MFGTIRKHQTWLWAIIITLTIISFVIFFSPYSRMNSSQRGPANYGTINGEKVSEEDFARAWRQVQLSYFFRNGNWADEDAKKMGFDPMRETYNWLLLVQKQKQLGIHVSEDAATQVAREMVRPFLRGNLTSPEMFIKQVLQPRGIQADDWRDYVRHFLGIQELISTVALSGRLVTPQQAREMYQRENEELATEAVWFSASNYISHVAVAPDKISQFYSNRLANYRVPERVQVSYVAFPVTNFIAAAEAELKTNLTEIIDANFRRLGTNTYKGFKTPDDIKKKLREDILQGRALVAAKRKAAEFGVALEDLAAKRSKPGAADAETAARPEDLNTLAKTEGLTVMLTVPFDREEGPREFQVEPNFVKEAFKLTPTNKPIAGPFSGDDATYVIAYSHVFPSEIPPLDKIREQVTADCKHMEALTLARQAGLAFYPVLTNGMAQGKTFSALCVASKYTPVMLPPFSLSTRSLPEIEDHISLNGPGGLKELAFGTPIGQVSRFQDTSDGGALLYVKFKQPLDETKMKEQLPGFLNYVRQAHQNEVFNDWFRREADRGLRDTPLARNQQAPPANLGARSGKKS